MLGIAKSMLWVGIFMLLWVISLGCSKRAFVRRNGASVLDGMWWIRQIVSVTWHLQAPMFFLHSFRALFVSCLVLYWISCNYLKCTMVIIGYCRTNPSTILLFDVFSLLILALGCRCILCNCCYLTENKGPWEFINVSDYLGYKLLSFSKFFFNFFNTSILVFSVNKTYNSYYHVTFWSVLQWFFLNSPNKCCNGNNDWILLEFQMRQWSDLSSYCTGFQSGVLSHVYL